MNSEYQMKNKGNQLLVLLISALVLFIFGSAITSTIAAIPLSQITKLGSDTINTALDLFARYYDGSLRIDGITWSQYAQNYFAANPILFDNIRSFYCSVQFLTYMPLVVLLGYCLRHDLVKDFKNFIKNFKSNLGIIGGAFIGMLALSGLVMSIYEMIGVVGESANENIINLLLDSPGKWLMIISVVVFAPILEELIFRKLFIDTCEIRFKLKPLFAIIISTVLFAFIHVSDLESLKFIFQYMALALPICMAYHYSNNNIYVVTIIHIINNFLSVTMATILWMM